MKSIPYSKDDLDRFSRIEEQLLNKGEPCRLSQLDNFPYQTLDELNHAYEKKQLRFVIDYNSSFMKVIGTTNENIMHTIWLSLLVVIVLIDISLAIFFNKWIVLMGIPFAILGLSSSSPYSPFKNIVSGLGGLLFVGSFFFFDWSKSVIIGSMLFAQIFSITAREQYKMAVLDRALQFDFFFCYMFMNGYISLIDLKNNEVLSFNKN